MLRTDEVHGIFVPFKSECVTVCANRTVTTFIHGMKINYSIYNFRSCLSVKLDPLFCRSMVCDDKVLRKATVPERGKTMSTRNLYDLADLELLLVRLFQLPHQTKASLYLHFCITPLKLRKILTLTINGQRRPASPSCRYTHGERNSTAYWN
jgi:hypothetical protein